jgi:hypothetical protein
MDDELRREPGIDRRSLPVDSPGGPFQLRPLAISTHPSHTDRGARLEVMRA